MRFLRQPVFHFLLLGTVIFAVAAWQGINTSGNIRITPELLQQLSATHKQLMGVAPESNQLRAMVAEYIEQELWLQEAQRLGLEQGDEIIRQRLIQKMQWVAEQQAGSLDPDEAALRAYYQQYQGEFMEAENVTFHQLFFSPDRSGSGEARQRAETALSAVKQQKSVQADRFPLFAADTVGPLTQQQALALFGNSDFSTQLFTQEPSQWSGPWQSGFGWHLLQVTERAGGQPIPFESIVEQVRAHWRERTLQERRDAVLREISKRVHVKGLELLDAYPTTRINK